jgi:hypothetical protein
VPRWSTRAALCAWRHLGRWCSTAGTAAAPTAPSSSPAAPSAGRTSARRSSCSMHSTCQRSPVDAQHDSMCTCLRVPCTQKLLCGTPPGHTALHLAGAASCLCGYTISRCMAGPAHLAEARVWAGCYLGALLGGEAAGFARCSTVFCIMLCTAAALGWACWLGTLSTRSTAAAHSCACS